MTLKHVEYQQKSYKGISYRKSFTATGTFDSRSLGDFRVDFQFTVENHALKNNEVRIELIGDYPYPLLNIKQPLLEWIGNNITL